MEPVSVSVFAKANSPSDSSHKRDLFSRLLFLVNTIPKSAAVPVLPSPNTISLSLTANVVLMVVVTAPETVRLPVIVTLYMGHY